MPKEIPAVKSFFLATARNLWQAGDVTTVSDAFIPPLGAASQPLRSHVPGSPAAESRHQRRLRLARERNRLWRLANPGKEKARRKSWESRNPEQRRITKRAWAKRNPDKQKVRILRWRRNHPEHHALNKRGWRARWIHELRPGYIRKMSRRNSISLELQKQQIQLCRTRKLFATLAVAGVLKT